MALENNQIENSNISNDEISFKEIIFIVKEWAAFLKSKWKLIIIAGIIGGLIGLILVFNKKPTYLAELTFAMDEDKGGGISGAVGLASSFGIDLGGGGGGGAFSASNLGELMKSRLIVEKVLLSPIQTNKGTTTLAEYFIQINGLRKGWELNPVLKNIQFATKTDRSKFTFQQDSIFKKIHQILIDKDVLSILQKDKKVTILTIQVTSQDELFSKLFCEKLAKETSNFYIQTKSKKAKINVEVLQKQVDSVKNELNYAITGMSTEIDHIYNLNPALNIKSTPSKKRQIDIQANTTILTNLVVQLELAKIGLRKETPLIQLIDLPILPLDKNKPSKLKSIILGGLLSVILCILYLIFGRIYRKIVE